jgi:hypothetical protein
MIRVDAKEILANVSKPNNALKSAWKTSAQPESFESARCSTNVCASRRRRSRTKTSFARAFKTPGLASHAAEAALVVTRSPQTTLARRSGRFRFGTKGQFLALNTDVFGRLDPDADPISADLHDTDPHPPIDDNFFPCLASQYQHSITLPAI